MKQLAPSILSADFSRLGEEVGMIEKAGAHLIHVDVMDGHFVPNISYGATVMKSLKGKTDLHFDVHLMIEKPDDFLDDFITDQTEYITVHQEACNHLDRTIEHIKSKGVKAGVSLNPATPVTNIYYVLEKVDMVLLMSVNPGFGGQSYISYVEEKIEELIKIRKEKNLKFLVEIDGGITKSNLHNICSKGVDIIVAGSAIFKGEKPEKNTKEFLKIMEEF